MRVWILLLIFTLALVSSGSGSEGKESKELSRFRAKVRKRLEAFRKEVELTLDFGDADKKGQGGRSKRATITADNPLSLARQRRKISPSKSSSGLWKVKAIRRVTNGLLSKISTLDVNVIGFKNRTYLGVLELQAEGTTDAVLYSLTSRRNYEMEIEELMRRDATGAQSLEMMEIEGNLFLLPLLRNGSLPVDGGSPLLKADLVKNEFVRVQSIMTPHGKAAVFWMGSGDQANAVFLAIAPEKKGKEYLRSRVDIGIYQWQGAYFDQVSQIQGNNPQALTHFAMLNNHFLAVANYMDDTGATAVHSEIFKYLYSDGGKFVSFQKIRTHGAKDIKYFELNQGERVDRFLAIANHCEMDEKNEPNYRVKSVIMKFAQHRFVPFKSFLTYGALQFLPVSWGDKFYLVLLEIQRLQIIQYNGWNFVHVAEYTTGFQRSQEELYSMRLRAFPSEPNFAISSILPEQFNGGIFSVSIEEKDDYSALGAGIEKWCNDAKRKLSLVDLPALESAVKSAPKIDDKEILLNHPVKFTGELKATMVRTQAVSTKGISFGPELARKLKSFHIEDIQGNVDLLKKKVHDSIALNQDQVIGTNIKFQQVEYESPDFQTVSADIDNWNGVRVKSIVNGLIFTNAEADIRSLTTNSVEILEPMTAVWLNGDPLLNYATKSKGNIFTKRNTFEVEVQLGGSSSVTGTFAGVDFNQRNFLLVNGNQSLSGTVNVANSHVENLYTTFLNGRDIQKYFDDAVPLNGDAVITAPHSWESVKAEHVTVTKRLSGVNLTELYNLAVRTKGNGPQHSGRARFESLHSKEVHIMPHIKINGKYDLSKDFVSTSAGNYSIGELVLKKKSKVANNLKTSKLGRFLASDNNFGLFMRTSPKPQVLKGKQLRNIHFSDNVEADNLDGVNLKDWKAENRIELRISEITNKVIIHGELSIPSIQVRKSLRQNGTELLPILANVASKTGQSLPGNCDIVFESLKVEGETKVDPNTGTVNGARPIDWLRKDQQNANVTGKKVFLEDLILEDDSSTGSLFSSEGEDVLRVIPNLLRHGENQTINVPTVFKGSLRADHVQCRNITLGGVQFSSLLFKVGDQTVDVPTSFEHAVEVEELIRIVKTLQFESLNGGNFSKDVASTLRTSGAGTQAVRGDMVFEQGLIVDSVQVGRVRGAFDLARLFASLVRKDRKIPLDVKSSSTVSFLHGLTTSSLQFGNQLNGISKSDWGISWLVSGPNQTVHTPVKFLGDLTVDTTLWLKKGKVGNIDVAFLNKNTLRRNDKNITNLGEVHFAGDNPSVLIDSLHLGENSVVNGVNMKRDVLHKHSKKPQEITGKKTFSSLHVDGNLQAKRVQGANVDEALRFYFSNDTKSFRRDKLKILGSLRVNVEPFVTSSVNGENLRDLLKNVWFINQPAVLLHRPKFLGPLAFHGESSLQGKGVFNKMNLLNIKTHYMSKTLDQTWTRAVTLEGSVTIDILEADVVGGNAPLNSVWLPTFLEKVLTNGTEQTVEREIPILHTNRVTLSPSVLPDGVNLDKELASVHGPNVFHVPVVLNQIHAHVFHLNPRATKVDGVNLTEWVGKGLKTRVQHKLRRPLVLKNLGFAKNLKVQGLTNGINMSNVLLKSGDQRIETPVHVEGDLSVPKGVHVNGLYNGGDFDAMISDLVRKSGKGADVINGTVVFEGPVSADHVVAEGLFQGQNLAEKLKKLHTGDIIPTDLHFRAKENYQALTAFTEHAVNLTQRRAVWVEYFVPLETLKSRDHYIPRRAHVDLTMWNKTLTLVRTQPIEGKIEVLVKTEGNRKESCIPVVYPVSHATVLGYNDNPFLAVASGPDITKNYRGAVFLYRYSPLLGQFEKTQTLDVESPLDLDLQLVNPTEEVLLFVLTKNPINNVLVYKFHGVAGWSLEHQWTAEGGHSIEAEEYPKGGKVSLLVTVKGASTTYRYRAIFKGGSSLAPRYPPV